MTIGIIHIKIKLPDNITDKEWYELVKKYIDINPPKHIRANRYSDTWECWL